MENTKIYFRLHAEQELFCEITIPGRIEKITKEIENEAKKLVCMPFKNLIKIEDLEIITEEDYINNTKEN